MELGARTLCIPILNPATNNEENQMHNDPDVKCFLKQSGVYMDINGLGRDWEKYFIDSIAGTTDKSLKQSFQRGFAKAVLGHLSADEYENATGWNFDTEEEFRAHLKEYWQMFYGDDKAEEVLAANTD